MIKGIPSKLIVKTSAKNNKDYELDFINTDSNSDQYELKVFLRKYDQDSTELYKIRLILKSGILAYPALEMSWKFDDDEYELASRVFHRICDEVDFVKTEFDKSMMPVSTISAKIKESIRPISIKHQEHLDSVPMKELTKLEGVSDWRMSIYSGRYPNTSKDEIKNFKKNEVENLSKTKSYKTREKY